MATVVFRKKNGTADPDTPDKNSRHQEDQHQDQQIRQSHTAEYHNQRQSWQCRKSNHKNNTQRCLQFPGNNPPRVQMRRQQKIQRAFLPLQRDRRTGDHWHRHQQEEKQQISHQHITTHGNGVAGRRHVTKDTAFTEKADQRNPSKK